MMQFKKNSTNLPVVIALVSLLGIAFTSPSLAQNFSYDGNRWYEIEVSIFTNENAAGQSSELTIPEKIDLSFPDDIRQLVPASRSFSIPFEDSAGLSFPDNGSQQNEAQSTGIFGPPADPGENKFRVTDFRRDPYIALGSGAAKFSEYNDDIDSSPEHRLLFHAVWRQPVMNRIQSTAIFVSGGERYGMHTELEGSLRFSYNVNRVDLEARLWLMDFSSAMIDPPLQNGNGWKVPPAPFPSMDSLDAEFTPVYEITNVRYMNQTRSMTSNTLHYLDHPDMGLLVEIRPYELPEPEGFTLD